MAYIFEPFMDSIDFLKRNLRAYISKYYLSKTFGGAVLTLFVAAILWIGFAGLEFLGNFGVAGRALMFFSFSALALSVIITQIAVPIFRLIGLLKPKSEIDAAKEIGQRMSAIDDQLANALQLQNKLLVENSTLIKASLKQKSLTLNKYRFDSIVQFDEAMRWAKYLVIPCILISLFWIIDPAILKDSSKRIINFNQSYLPRAPFEFELLNDQLVALEGASYEIQLKLNGKSSADYVEIEIGSVKYRMKNSDGGVFTHVVNRVSQPFAFSFWAAGYGSEGYMVKVLQTPKLIKNLSIVDYPEYTGLQDEILLNRSQLKVPEGTKIRFEFQLQNAQSAKLLNNLNEEIGLITGQKYLADCKVSGDQRLILALSGISNLKDTALVNLFAIPDQFPSIEVEEIIDSSATQIRYFSGLAADDYGLTSIYFVRVITEADGQSRTTKSKLGLRQNSSEFGFQYMLTLDSVILNESDRLEYYFETWDNDGVNGSKSSRSAVWSYRAPSAEEMKAQNIEQSEKTKSSLESELSALDQTEAEIDALKKDLLQKKKTDWEDKEKLKEILENQKAAMQNLMQKAADQKNQDKANNRFNEYSPELIEKQQRIQEMFEELFDDEFKEKFEEYQNLLNELNKQQMLEKLDEMKLDNEALEKEMDRTLELFKKLEYEKKLEETISKSEKISQSQEELMNKTEDKNNTTEQLKNEQTELRKELQSLAEDIKKLDELNKALEEPFSQPDTDSLLKRADENMVKASEELGKQSRKNAKEKQNDSKDAIEELSKSLSESKQEEEEEQQGENLEDMQQLLENLVDLSLNQEQIMKEIRQTKSNDPKYVEITKRQKDVIEDIKVVEDSLLALTKRVPELDRTVNDELTKAKFSMSRALENIANQPPNQEEQYKQMAAVDQQMAMTSLNNLAVLFDEAIRMMQQQMKSEMKGSGECKKPGQGKGSKPSASEARKMQENLSKRLEELKKSMAKGPNPKGMNPGEKPGQGAGGMSKELARMAAEQAAIREQLRELENQINSAKADNQGSQLKNLQKLMEQNEEDILYQKITQQTIDRQQEIITKLLESEKAEREREMDQKRESSSSEQDYSLPPHVLQQYKQLKEQELELYKTLPPNLKPFYRNEVNRYFSEFAK